MFIIYLDIDIFCGIIMVKVEEYAQYPGHPQKGEQDMPEKTDAQKRAQKAYMEKFAVARVRMDHAKYECVQAHAEAQGQSVNAYINAAIDEKMSREAVGGPTRPADTRAVSLPSEDQKRTPTASEGRTGGIADED